MMVFDLFTYEGFSHMRMVIKVHSTRLSGFFFEDEEFGTIKTISLEE